MSSNYIKMTKNVLWEIAKEFKKLLDKGLENKLGNELTQEEVIIQCHLSSINEGLKFCPDRQMAEFRMTYNMLKQQDYKVEPSLDEMVESFIAAKKEASCDIAFTPSTDQNVHVLNYWKSKLSEILGFNYNFITKIGTMKQDPYRGENGNALNAFFTIFTPEMIISELHDYMNRNNRLLCNAAHYIYNNIEDDEERSKYAVANEEGFDFIVEIKREFAEFYLLEMEILKKNVDFLAKEE